MAHSSTTFNLPADKLIDTIENESKKITFKNEKNFTTSCTGVIILKKYMFSSCATKSKDPHYRVLVLIPFNNALNENFPTYLPPSKMLVNLKEMKNEINVRGILKTKGKFKNLFSEKVLRKLLHRTRAEGQLVQINIFGKNNILLFDKVLFLDVVSFSNIKIEPNKWNPGMWKWSVSDSKLEKWSDFKNTPCTTTAIYVADDKSDSSESDDKMQIFNKEVTPEILPVISSFLPKVKGNVAAKTTTLLPPTAPEKEYYLKSSCILYDENATAGKTTKQ